MGAKDIQKEVLPLYGEHCVWCQVVHNWVQHQRESPKVNVLCAVSSQNVHFILLCRRNRYWHDVSDMLQLWLMPQLQNILTFIFQQDGNPAHLHREVHQSLNTVLPGRWIGRASENDHTPMLWPPEVPWNYALWFFLWGYVKDWVFVPPLPCDLADLEAWIIAAVMNIDAPMLTCFWQELEYRIDVCCAIHSAHRTSLVVKKNFFSFPVWTIPLRKVLWFSCQKICNHGELYETPCTFMAESNRKLEKTV
jgi:hypothetical protein